jgi:fibronectin type 3 domain-containing protein
MKARIALGIVGAVLGLGCGEETPQGPAVPDPPGAVTATVANGTIEITWDDVPGATSYRIYMAAVGGVKRVNYATLTENMFHSDLIDKFDHPPGLNPNTTYFFVVTAVNAEGESVESCEVTARINPATGGTC